MTIQQKCAERIYELLPHKKELEFGCHFFWKEMQDYNEPTYHAVFENWKEKNKSVRCLTHLGQQGVVSKDRIVKIIGQPIRLADILLAIHSRNNVKYDEGHFYFNHGFVVFQFHKETLGITGTIEYNLSQDNILNQSNEFCEFIYNILSE